MKALNLKMRLMALILNMIDFIRPMPRPPGPGRILKQIVLTPIGFKQVNYITTLLKQVNNMALSQGIEQIFFICKKGHPLLDSLKGFIHIDTGMYLYIKPLCEGLSLNGQSVFINGLDL